ncbi:phage tail protein [Streptomyces sp. DH37]|uniref:phage tail protein n=1 Tax=Streptomyces sp. DH37 TaxID=3040122 RepID=UPI002442A908|nr:phage tail protein [Streptomyces sp. DH37]MDG9701656.1 phage tail protein [Streptomyces sp. DH37]
MLRISAEVLAALPQAVGRPYRAEWSNDGGLTWQSCGLVAGSAQITASRTAEARYTGSATLTGVALGRDGINPISTAVRLWQGVTLPRSSPVWFPAGRYAVTRCRLTKTGIEVEFGGVEDELRAASFPAPQTIGPGRAKDLIEALVAAALPGASVAWRAGVDPDTPVPSFLAEEDRWSVLAAGADSTGQGTGIAQALAGEIWADARGVITVGPVPTIDDPIVWRIGAGVGGVLVEPQQEQSSEGLANVWAVSGESSGEGAAIGPAYAWDSDPNSLTYAGPDPIQDPLAAQREGLHWVRLRVARHSDALITSMPQAQAVARAKLADSLGLQASLSLTAVCNPALEPGDVVEVETEPGRWERHLIDSLSYTLGAASMSCSTRTTSRRL